MLGRNVSWAVGLGLVGALVLGSCGDDGGVGGGGTASISFTVDGTPKTYSADAFGRVESGNTWVRAGVVGLPSEMLLTWTGASTGTYTVTAGTLVVQYTDDAGTVYHAQNGVAGSGSATVTSFGPVGGRIEGTFFAVVDDGASTTLNITGGTFSVVRVPDA